MMQESDTSEDSNAPPAIHVAQEVNNPALVGPNADHNYFEQNQDSTNDSVDASQTSGERDVDAPAVIGGNQMSVSTDISGSFTSRLQDIIRRASAPVLASTGSSNLAAVGVVNADHNYIEHSSVIQENTNISVYASRRAEESINSSLVATEPMRETERDLPAPVDTASTVDLTSPPTPTRKKRRISVASEATPSPNKTDEEGLICSVCLEPWELSGPHRIVSLRCGHLFGESCIHRWFSESVRLSGGKVCPQCKEKASNKDIRFLYVKRLRAIDRSEEHSLREQLIREKKTSDDVRLELSRSKLALFAAENEIQSLKAENQKLRTMLINGSSDATSIELIQEKLRDQGDLLRHKVFLKSNIELAREPGCRVMIFNKTECTLLASQISSQRLFPGYGLRFINVETFNKYSFMHTSAKFVRDICLSADQQQVAVTSVEACAKLFDLRTKQATISFNAHDKLLWACDMDRNERENFLYLGAQNGSTFIFDIRFPNATPEEFLIEGDLSPVVNVASISASKLFPEGGFLVCKLQSLWFFEYSPSNCTAIPTRLHIDGPFIAMRYDKDRDSILVSTRSNANFTFARFIYGTLAKVNNITVFDVVASFNNSKTTPIMSRATQINVKDNTLIAGYLQDVKMLGLYDVQRKEKLQSMSVSTAIYDICPVYTADSTYLAALTDTKCRVYNLTSY